MSSLMVPVLSSLMSLAANSALASDSLDELRSVLYRADANGSFSVLLFDLDETTVDSTPRRFESLKKVIADVCKEAHPDCVALKGIELAGLYALDNRYDDGEFLRRAGAKDSALISRITHEAFQVYLSGAYILEKDRFYPGALAFLKRLRSYGAQVYFVSSRRVKTQFAPTFQFLVREGVLKPGEEKYLWLKEDSEESIVFKTRAAKEIEALSVKAHASVDGIFENEPENMAAWMKAAPGAKAFFVDGAFQNAGAVAPNVTHLKDFELGL